VLIPEANIEDLMLRQDVVEAVQTKKFHIWPASKIEQGVEIAYGNVRGHEKWHRHIDAGTVFRACESALDRNGETLKEFE